MSTSHALFRILITFSIFCALAHIKSSASKEQIFDRVSNYALAYENMSDKEQYLTSIYNDVKDIDEALLPQDLKSFVIKVKVSQFCK